MERKEGMVALPTVALKDRNLTWISWFPSRLRRWTCAPIPLPRPFLELWQDIPKLDGMFKHWPRGCHHIVQ